MRNDAGQLDSLVAYAASRLRGGDAIESVRADLLGREVAGDKADQVIAEAKVMNRRRGLRKGAMYLAIGIVCSLLGVIITSATYSSAARQGGSYFVTIGLFGFGLGYTIGGIVRIVIAACTGK